MTNKKKKLIRSISNKTGLSYQGALNKLNKNSNKETLESIEELCDVYCSNILDLYNINVAKLFLPKIIDELKSFGFSDEINIELDGKYCYLIIKAIKKLATLELKVKIDSDVLYAIELSLPNDIISRVLCIKNILINNPNNKHCYSSKDNWFEICKFWCIFSVSDVDEKEYIGNCLLPKITFYLSNDVPKDRIVISLDKINNFTSEIINSSYNVGTSHKETF